jgi:hypothetical protein
MRAGASPQPPLPVAALDRDENENVLTSTQASAGHAPGGRCCLCIHMIILLPFCLEICSTVLNEQEFPLPLAQPVDGALVCAGVGLRDGASRFYVSDFFFIFLRAFRAATTHRSLSLPSSLPTRLPHAAPVSLQHTDQTAGQAVAQTPSSEGLRVQSKARAPLC